jgi:hypothetical protein
MHHISKGKLLCKKKTPQEIACKWLCMATGCDTTEHSGTVEKTSGKINAGRAPILIISLPLW